MLVCFPFLEMASLLYFTTIIEKGKQINDMNFWYRLPSLATPDDAPTRRLPLLPYYHLPMQQPRAAAAPYVSIDPILGRGSSVAVPTTTVNIPNGGDLLLNASSKLSDITTNTPWLSTTMDSTDNNHQCTSI